MHSPAPPVMRMHSGVYSLPPAPFAMLPLSARLTPDIVVPFTAFMPGSALKSGLRSSARRSSPYSKWLPLLNRMRPQMQLQRCDGRGTGVPHEVISPTLRASNMSGSCLSGTRM